HQPSSDMDLKVFDWPVQADITGATEPRMYRAIINSRIGSIDLARSDMAVCLNKEPANPAYIAVAALVEAKNGDRSKVSSLALRSLEAVAASTDQALNAMAHSFLGESFYIGGGTGEATKGCAASCGGGPSRSG